MKRSFVLAGMFLACSGCSLGTKTQRNEPAETGARQKSATIRFEDVTARAGIRFTHFNGADGRLEMPESMGSGGAFFDYDRDGWLDVFLVNSSSWPDRPLAPKTCALYRNQRDGTFRDVTKEAGLAIPMYGQGCAVGDFDNDGYDDLYVSCVGPGRLFRNQGNGRFANVTANSGLDACSRWSWHTSAAWLDYDRDGLLDLFVCRYVRWSPELNFTPRSAGKPTYSGPDHYQAEHSELFRNLGHGRFQDVSKKTGIAGSLGKALGVLPQDVDGDGWPDLLVTNDTLPTQLFRNEDGRRFQETAVEVGLAVGEAGKPRAGMGVDVSDLDNDGKLSVAIGNFSGEGLALFREQNSLYRDAALTSGLVPASLSRLTFGLSFLDADRDGWQDLVTYNGHVDPRVGEQGGAITYRQSPQLFRNERGRFVETTTAAGPAFQQAYVGRGSAWGDFDNDGRPDLLLCENNGPARLLRNVSADTNHWLGIRLIPATGNRNAYGAEVRVTAGGITQRRWIRSGSSYLSHCDLRALFGLGASEQVSKLEIRWPDGQLTTTTPKFVDRYLEITGTAP